MLHAQQHATHIDVEDLVVSLDLDFGDITRWQRDAGIVESEVETAKALEGPSDGIRTVLLARDVGLHEQPLPAGLLDERDRFLALCFPPAGDDDIGTLPSECDGGGATDAAGAAGDENDFFSEDRRRRRGAHGVWIGSRLVLQAII